MNVLFQFLFHELRDTERIRKWFRNRLTVEFEELLTRSAVGRMFGSIKVSLLRKPSYKFCQFIL